MSEQAPGVINPDTINPPDWSGSYSESPTIDTPASLELDIDSPGDASQPSREYWEGEVDEKANRIDSLCRLIDDLRDFSRRGMTTEDVAQYYEDRVGRIYDEIERIQESKGLNLES